MERNTIKNLTRDSKNIMDDHEKILTIGPIKESDWKKVIERLRKLQVEGLETQNRGRVIYECFRYYCETYFGYPIYKLDDIVIKRIFPVKIKEQTSIYPTLLAVEFLQQGAVQIFRGNINYRLTAKTKASVKLSIPMIAIANFHVAHAISTMIRKGQYKSLYKEKNDNPLNATVAYRPDAEHDTNAIRILVQSKYSKEQKEEAKAEKTKLNYDWYEFDTPELDFGFDTSFEYAKEILETNGHTWKAKKLLKEKLIGKSDSDVIEEMMRIIPRAITLEWMPTAIYKEPNKKDLTATLKVVDYATLDQTRYKIKRKSTGDAEDNDDEMKDISEVRHQKKLN